MKVDTAATDIDQLTRLDVGQQPLVFRHARRRFGLGKDDATDGKQQGDRQDGQVARSARVGMGVLC